MNVYSAIQRRRSIRRFKNQEISDSSLVKMVDAARLAPSAANIQPLEYITINNRKTCDKVFPLLKWARLIEGGDTPGEEQLPVAYIVVLINRQLSPRGGSHEVGAAVQNILLAALEDGIGSCWIRSFNADKLTEALKIPDHCKADSVIALGVPAESPVTEPSRKHEVKYWRDDRGLLHVPKRKLGDIIHREKYSKS